MNGQQVFAVRSRLAHQLKFAGHSFEAIAQVLKLGTKEQARRHVARGERLAVKEVGQVKPQQHD